MSSQKIGITDARTLPVYFIPRNLLRRYKPSSNGILAYNAIAYAADGSRCRSMGMKALAALVGFSDDSMRRGLDELVRLQAIRVKRHQNKSKNGKPIQLPNEYILVDLPDTDMPI